MLEFLSPMTEIEAEVRWLALQRAHPSMRKISLEEIITRLTAILRYLKHGDVNRTVITGMPRQTRRAF